MSMQPTAPTVMSVAAIGASRPFLGSRSILDRMPQPSAMGVSLTMTRAKGYDTA